MQKARFPTRIAQVCVLTATVILGACADEAAQPAGPSVDDALLTAAVSQQEVSFVIDVQERHTPALMSTMGVVGTAVTLGDNGQPVVEVLAMDGHAELPPVLDGVPVRITRTEAIVALQEVDALAKPTCGKPNLPPCPPPPPGLSERHPRPVPIGVSTGHPDITAGTLGFRGVGGGVVAVSNNHVYANENLASIGDAVIQPGAFDGGSSPADDIGTLADYEPIDFTSCALGGSNTIDAAIASTSTAAVGNSTPAGIGYGTPRSQTMAPALNMRIQKVGRTTGHTRGTITSINGTVNVNYDSGVACFVGQIISGIQSTGGDSGSLAVVDGRGRYKNDDRKPVGLLFAGGGGNTIFNPIGPVLTRFGISVDGN